ncbi:hypothetical protein C8J56DRAFT_1053035 [Mycena floridula]|nr:hypothetical protein C8J56DRAFT_1053035 [Mycena floridula]
MLQTSEKLQSLDFLDWWMRPTLHELIFNHLHHLRCDPSVLSLFLALPALEILDLNCLLFEGSCTPLPAFIRRSSPRLKSLILPHIPSDQDSRAVIDALDMLPNLQKLKLRCSYGDPTNAVINHLKVKTVDSAPLPNSQHLSFLYVNGANEIRLSCIELIESRVSLDYDFPRLKSVQWTNLGFGGLFMETPELYPRVVALEKQGLQVKWD